MVNLDIAPVMTYLCDKANLAALPDDERVLT